MGRDKGRKYKTPQQFDKAVDKYVTDCRVAKKPLTLTGLSLSMGFANRNSITHYKNLPEFVESVDRAKMIVENQYEENLHARGTSPVGSIFALKNFGWTDKQEMQVGADDSLLEMFFKVREKELKEKNEK